MRIQRTLFALAVTAMAGLGSTAVQAQSNASSPVANKGPVVPGVCMLSREAIFANAKAGQAASARLKQLAEQIQTQLQNERTPIDADIQAYQNTASSLSADQRKQKEEALSARMRTFQADQQTKSRQLEATRAQAMEQISQAAQPAIASAYQARNCGLLLDRNAVLGGNTTNDITAAVVQGLDAKMSTISFNLAPPPAAGNAAPTN